jgi:hypothetical protein
MSTELDSTDDVGTTNVNNNNHIVEVEVSTNSELFHNYNYLKILDFIINDVVVVFFSLCDVFLDIAVCYQFYIENRMQYFQISIIIFVISQLSYSFLFVVTWAKYKSPIKKIVIFIITLPFSQLVPFFTWIESFRLVWLDKLIVNVGLIPTLDPTSDFIDDANESQINNIGNNEDALWSYLQQKYHAHAGFLVEALAEAIPQCLLQVLIYQYINYY